MPANTCLISTVPNGAVPTVTGLQSIDISTVPEGSTVIVGGDNGGIYTFVAGAVGGGFATNSTGRWLPVSNFTGVAIPPVTASTYSGANESFVVLSGAFPAYTITYTLPSAAAFHGKDLTIKTLSTGSVTIQRAGADQIWDQGTTPVTSLVASLTGGYVWNFTAVTGRFYRTDARV